MKVMVIKIKSLLIEEYLNKIRPYLKDIKNLEKSDTWKIQLTIAINYVSPKDLKCIQRVIT